MINLFSDVAANATLDFEGALKRVLTRHWYVLGQEVTNFESAFATYVGVEHCVSVANGSDALEIALRALDVGRGDVVVAVANAGFYSSTAIHAIGAVPLYVDVDTVNMTMTVETLAIALAQQPKCVIVTHLYGQLADMDALKALCSNAGVALIEDCAQSHGARRDGRMAGSWGDAACFSFYPTKNLGALGDGGAVVCNSDELNARLRTLRQYGWSSKYQVVVQGGRNSRLDEMQAAILNEKLPLLDRWNAERRSIASRYNAAFAAFPILALPAIGDDYVAHLYVIRIEGRDAFREFLKEQGVATDAHYPIPDHRQPAYPGARIAGALPVTEAASQTVVSLPCFPGMSDEQVEQVIAAVSAYFRR